MTVSETTKKALKHFGLTEYEVKAYIALVEAGTVPASQLSTTARLPYSKIYEILGNLERKGRMENSLKASQSDALTELEPLYEKSEGRERPDIWGVRGQNSVRDRIKEPLG